MLGRSAQQPHFLPEQDRITNLSCIYEQDTAAKHTKTRSDLHQGLKIADDEQADEELGRGTPPPGGSPQDHQTYDERLISAR